MRTDGRFLPRHWRPTPWVQFPGEGTLGSLRRVHCPPLSGLSSLHLWNDPEGPALSSLRVSERRQALPRVVTPQGTELSGTSLSPVHSRGLDTRISVAPSYSKSRLWDTSTLECVVLLRSRRPRQNVHTAAGKETSVQGRVVERLWDGIWIFWKAKVITRLKVYTFKRQRLLD